MYSVRLTFVLIMKSIEKRGGIGNQMLSLSLPLIKSFYATTVLKAFVLNAIAVALIATFAVEIRRELDDVKGQFYLFINPFFAGSAMTERQKAIVVALASFLGAILVYHIMYVVFGFGGGMLTSGGPTKFV